MSIDRCLSCGQKHLLDQPCPQQMRDTTQMQEARGGMPFPGHNRKARRRIAKDYKLFQDPTGEAWKRANKHMKLRRDQHNG